MLFLNDKTCIDFLERKGYCIYKPFNLDTVPNNSVELTKYFFSKARSVYNINYSSILWKLEINYAKTFIKQMSYEGNHKDKEAIYKCKFIIDSVFSNIDFFDVYYRFNTLKILSANSGAWIIEKCFSLDDDNFSSRTGYTKEEWSCLEKEYENNIGFPCNFNDIKKELVDMIGENHGKGNKKPS